MKSILNFFVLLLSIGSVSGQTYSYSPMIDTSLIWYSHNDIYPMGADVRQNHDYWFTGSDTMIGAIYYSTVRLSPARVSFFIADSFPLFYIHSDTSQKYFLYDTSGDKLLYDFRSHVGDTLYRDINHTVRYYIQAIDTVVVNNSLRKHFLVYVIDTASYTTTGWVEGIGDINSGLLSLLDPNLRQSSSFSFCGLSKNGVMIYPTYGAPLCNASVGIHEINTGSVSIYPVPASGLINISLQGANIVTYQLYTVEGKLLISEKLSGDQISIRDFAPGIYMLNLYDHEGINSTYKVIKE